MTFLSITLDLNAYILLHVKMILTISHLPIILEQVRLTEPFTQTIILLTIVNRKINSGKFFYTEECMSVTPFQSGMQHSIFLLVIFFYSNDFIKMINFQFVTMFFPLNWIYNEVYGSCFLLSFKVEFVYPQNLCRIKMLFVNYLFI